MSFDEKWILEEAATHYFIKALNEQEETAFKKVLHTDRPDFIIEDENGGQRIGVEVTHLFYNSHEAQALMGRGRETLNQSDDPETYIKRLNHLLEQKAYKAFGYEFEGEGKMALLVRVTSPNFDAGDFERNRDLIKVPENIYDHIWVLFYDFQQHNWGVLKELK